MKVIGVIRIDLAEQPKGIYITGEHTSISKLKDGGTIPALPFTVSATGVQVEVHSIDFSVESAPYAPVLPSGVTIIDNVVTINPSLVTFKMLSIRAKSEDEYYLSVFSIIIVEDGHDGEPGPNGTNYFPFGFWNETSEYYISDMGIPYVKVPDGTALGYSVYALDVPQATKGEWIASEWRMLESTEFLYMQESYIERLQAALVTAEKINALEIETGNIKILDGAKVGGTLQAKEGYFEGLVRNPFKEWNPDVDWWVSSEIGHPSIIGEVSTNVRKYPQLLTIYNRVVLPTENINGMRITVLNECTDAATNANGFGTLTIAGQTIKIFNAIEGVYNYTLERGEMVELLGIEGIKSVAPNYVTKCWIIVRRVKVFPTTS